MSTVEHAEEQAVGIRVIADMLDVAPNTVRSLARAGDIPGFKVGRVWRFFPTKVRARFEKPKVDTWAAPTHPSKRKQDAA